MEATTGYQLPAAGFRLGKRSVSIRPFQEEAFQEEAFQEEAFQEEAFQEEAFQEEAFQPRHS
jgi:hypothetical protein